MHLILHETKELMIILFNGWGNTKHDSPRDLRKALCQRNVLFFCCWVVGLKPFFYFAGFDITIYLDTAEEAVWHVLKCTAVYARHYNAIDCFAKLNFCHLVYNRNPVCFVCSACRLFAFTECSKKFKYLLSWQCTDVSLGVSSGSHFMNLWQFYL